MKVTVNSALVVIGTEHGVRQPGPSEVFASAPGGNDSSCKLIGFGADLKRSRLGSDEHPASNAAEARNAALLRMGTTVTVCG